MCGISGIINSDGQPVDRAVLEAMNRTITHRGPDGEGYYVNAGRLGGWEAGRQKGQDPGKLGGWEAGKQGHRTKGIEQGVWSIGNGKGNVGLGHRRLSIIDLSTGQQPLCNEDGSVWITFNGEIYNFIELKKELESKGHRFQTKSDTETIVHAYEEWGEDCVSRLRGMFAFAIWDEKRQRLILARDRVGKKPLYYVQQSNCFIFASEIKAILEHDEVDRNIDLEALNAYLSFGYVPSPLSIFKDIQKLPPASIAILEKNNLRIESYWHLEMDKIEKNWSESEAGEELLSIFDEAVKVRLISEVPLGAFLSGGVDSSAVVAAMSGMTNGHPVKTASIGFSDKKFDEQAFARLVANRYSTDHTEFVVEADALSIIDKLVWHFDEPFADSSAIPTYYVCKMAREKVTVALSGDGGDETFAGYANRYHMTRIEDRLRQILPAPFRTMGLGPLSAAWPKIDTLPRPLRLKAFLAGISKSFEEAYFRTMSFYFLPEMKRKLYNNDVMHHMSGYNAFSFWETPLSQTKGHDPVTRAQHADVNVYLPEDILVKVDRMSMANSLEVRAPILDHKVMEFAAKLQSSLKLNGGESKYIFKKINEKRLPHDVLYRKKQGFCVPLASWLRNELKEFAYGTLFSSDSGMRSYFNMPYIDRLWQKHQSGRQDNATPLWGLMMFELWRKKYL